MLKFAYQINNSDMPLRIKMPECIENETIGKSFNALFLNIILIMEESDDDEVVWDFKETRILNPFFVLPLLLYKNKCGKSVVYENLNEDINQYFESISFYDICDAEKLNGGFDDFLQHYIHEIYTPITKFPACEVKDDIRDSIITSIGKIIKKQLKIKGNLYSGLSYLLSEIIDNIAEHSKTDYGYIFAQYNENNKYVDICIVDEGITLLGSYLNIKRDDIESDIEAIQKASIGVSTKNRPEAENRGYGIITSRKMLVDGLHGQFFLFSGGAFYRYFYDREGSKEEYVNLPSPIKWEGTMVLLRIPYNEKEDFNYIDYLEG